MKDTKRRQLSVHVNSRRSVVFLVNFGHILHCFLVFFIVKFEQVNTDWE